ncbi:PAS domain-containing protein [Natronorubrum halophilum]|uniref:PAS domain-containing protein n=1 Tax=Natronorubrum halophilum TaxID=1702106 RepID=UPI000EF6762B|nr:PAS domain-containing protein [Natronorubrum halophilum]
MNRGLENPETTPVRALAIGSSTWLRRATTALENGDITVRGPLETPSELEDGRLDATDCVLTDEREILAATDETCPVVYAVDSADCEAIDRLQSAGATSVVSKSTVAEPAVLAHQIQQAVRLVTARRARTRQETWYQALLDQSSDLLLVIDADGTIAAVGPSVERVSGYDADALLGSQITDYVHPNDTPAVRSEFDDICSRESGATATIDYRCQHANGSWYIHETEITNRLEDDDIGGVVASIRDITDRHQVQQELDESFKRVSDAFFSLDSEWQFTYVNDRAGSLLDIEPSDALGRSISDLFPALRETAFEDAAVEAMQTQEPVSLERYYEPDSRWYNVHIYPSLSGISVYFRDVTDRIERERELEERTERLEAVVQNVPVVLFVFDGDGTITLAEGRALERIETSSGDIVGESLFDVFEDRPAIRADLRAALDGQATHSPIVLEDRVFETWCRPITADGSVERVIGTAVDVTERAQYQEALNALQEATTHLLTVESKQAACEYMVDVATDVLDLESVVYRFDEQRNELVPTAYSHGLEAAIGTPPQLQPNGSIAWETFITETPARFDDVRESKRVYDRTTAARSGLYIPIGEHGILIAHDPAPGQYDENTFELAKLFAATAETALDRIGRTRRLHGRERELKQQNTHLERLNDANQIRQDIEQLLLMADSRTEIEQGICDRLAALEACSFVWIGEPDPSGNQLNSQAQAGLERGYLDAITVTTVDDSAAEPTGRSARTQTPVYVENAADSVRDGTWRAEALSRNIQSVYTVPLVYDGFLYGVLSLYSDDRDAFDGPLRSMLADLGETIGYAIDAVKRKPTLGVDGIATIELELELEGDSPLCRLAERLGSRVEFEGATLRADGSPTVFVVTDSAVSSDAADDLTDIEGVRTISVIAETDAETLLQLQCTEPFLGTVVDSHGGTLRSFVTDGSETRAIIDVPETIEIRGVLSGLSRRGFAASLIARREQSTDDPSAIDISARNALLERLTDRQREVVQTAYHGGFFEWPRQTTGEGLADSLSISPPAFHKHVRAAEQKLFTALFDGSS